MVQERLITGTGPAWLLSVSLENELGIAVSLIGKRRGEIDTYGRHQSEWRGLACVKVVCKVTWSDAMESWNLHLKALFLSQHSVT